MSPAYVLSVIAGVAVATFLIRWSLIGAVGDRRLPRWLTGSLQYVPATVIPAVVAPRIFTNDQGAVVLDPAQVLPAAVALLAGVLTRSLVLGLVAGAVVFAAFTVMAT